MKIILLLPIVFFFSFSFAQTIPMDTLVHMRKLPNGFTYYIRHNEEPKNRVQMYLVNKVGSVLEDVDQQGLAHFMEHMNFNGLKHFPKNELVNYLQKSGVRFGADLNAYTSFDETVYQLPVPTDDPSVLQNGFQIMRDWAQDATLDPVEIDKERGVVLEEERLGRGAGERMQRQYFPVLLNQSRYAERLPIGKVDILETFKPEVIRRFHSDWYRPDLQALVVVGDIDVVKTEKLIQSLFSDLKTPSNERPRTKYEVPLTGENHFLTVTDKEMPQTVLQVIIKHKEEKLLTEEDYIHSIERQLFNQMISERYTELAQEPNLPYLEAVAGINGLLGGLDNFSLEVSLKKGKFSTGFKAAWEVIEKLKRYGFTETELARAKRNYLSGMETAFNEKGKTNSENFVGEYQRLFLNQEASPGIIWEYQFVKSHALEISLEDVNALIKEYIRNVNRDILILAPENNKAELPDSATVTSWINAVENESLSAFTDETNLLPLVSHMPNEGQVVSSLKNEKIGTTEVKLSNGVRVLLKPTDFKNDEIRFLAFCPGGTSLYSDAEYQNASSATLLAEFGVGTFNPAQLDKILSGKIVTVNPFLEDRFQGVQGFTRPEDLETALQLNYMRFTAPRKDSGLFNNLISNAKEEISNRYSNPKNVFDDTVTSVLGNYNYRRTPPTLEKIDQLDLERLSSIYKERFADASGFTFVFVGSFNVDSIMPLIKKYIGSLPSLNRAESPKDLDIHIPTGIIAKRVYKGSENKATVRMVYSGDYSYSPAINMQLNALKEVLQIKITQHLREDESEVYSPSVRLEYNKYPSASYSFTFSFGCAPKNADHLMDLVEKEIRTLRENGPQTEDIEKFKSESIRLHEVQYATNDVWLNYLAYQLENKEDLLMVLNFKQRLEKVTKLSVQDAAKKYLRGKNEIRFELLPENK
jgi:zinc protease